MKKLILLFLAFVLFIAPIKAYDNTPPIINYFEIKPAPNNILQIVWSIDDDEGLAGYKIYKNEEVLYSERITGTHYVSVYQDSSYDANKTYIYKLLVYDKANNSAEKSISFTYDSKPPKITSSTYIISNERRLDLTTDEDAICSFGYDPKKDLILIEEFAKKNHSVPLSKIVEGKNLIYVKCVDIFNNEMPSFTIVDFKYDITDPSKIGDAAYVIEDDKIKLMWDAASDENGILKYMIYDEDDRFIDSTPSLSWSETDRNRTKYYVSAVDKAGNEGAKTRIDINRIIQNETSQKPTKKTENQIKNLTKTEIKNNDKSEIILLAIISWVALGLVIAAIITWKIIERKKDPHGLRSYMIRRRRLRNFKVRFRI